MVTCTELFSDWMVFKSAFVDINTVAWYNGTLTSLKIYLSEISAAEVNKKIASEFVAKIRLNLSPEVAKRKVENLSASWDWAISEGYSINQNPWHGLSKLIKVPRLERPCPFTKEEIDKILGGFDSHCRYYQYASFVRFLFGTGCRTGEAIGLRWQDVSEDCSKIVIASQVTRRKRKATKTGIKRTFIISPKLQLVLQQMKRGKPTDSVFKFNGHTIDPCNFRDRAWKPILKVVGVSYRSPYKTRHTFISHCLEKGVSPVNIAQITGHDPNVLLKHYAGCVVQLTTPDIL